MRRGYIHCNLYKREESAFLVDEGQFITFGSDDEITRITGNDELIDLNGMFVVPGFIDSHMHLVETGSYLSSLQLLGTGSLQEIKEKIENYMIAHPEEEWIVGRGWNHENMGGQIPDRAFIDAICPDKPVVLIRLDGHIMTCNTKALEVAHIDETTSIDGGVIRLREGILEENAEPLVLDLIPQPDEETIRGYIREANRLLNEYGVTTSGSDDFLSVTDSYKPIIKVYERMAYEQDMTVRVNEQCRFKDVKQFSKFLDEGYATGIGDDLFMIGPLKLITDGSLGSKTAALSEPYENSDTSGYMLMEEEEIELFVKLANRFNMPTIAHVIGDKSTDVMLKIYKDNIYEGNPLHHGLVHCQIMRQDQINQINEMNLSCYIQSLFFEDDAPILPERVGEKRAATCYPFRTLFENTITSNGSDSPVVLPNAIKGIHYAVNGAEGIREKMTVEQAIDSYTIAGARQFFMEERLGKIEKGYYADFVVLDQDLTKIDPKDILNTRIMMTVMNGETVFER